MANITNTSNKNDRPNSPTNQNDKNNNNFKYLNSNGKLETYCSAVIGGSAVESYSQLNNSTTNSSTSIPSPLSDQIL